MTPHIPTTRLTLKEGRYYVRRDGRRVGPARLTASLFYPFAAWPDTYSKDGKFCLGIEAHALDLISEVPAKRIAPAAKARKVREMVKSWGFVAIHSEGFMEHRVIGCRTKRQADRHRVSFAYSIGRKRTQWACGPVVPISLPAPKKASKP